MTPEQLESHRVRFEQPSAYPKLPKRFNVWIDNDDYLQPNEDVFTATQMRAYVDADRAQRAAPGVQEGEATDQQLSAAMAEGNQLGIKSTDALRILAAYRNAAQPPQQSAQPVAWRYLEFSLSNPKAKWCYSDKTSPLGLYEPLYAAAQPVEVQRRLVSLSKDRQNRIYLAGPMTGYEDFNFPAFNALADKLRANGFHVENPAEHGIVDGAEWADYLHYDIGRLATCAYIMLLPGWSKSKGAALEMSIAKGLGMGINFAEGAEAQPVEVKVTDRDFKESVGLMLAAVGYTEEYARQWPEEKVSITFKRWFHEQIEKTKVQRVPLTYRQIAEATHAFAEVPSDKTIGIARAIEAAHGIKPTSSEGGA